MINIWINRLFSSAFKNIFEGWMQKCVTLSDEVLNVYKCHI